MEFLLGERTAAERLARRLFRRPLDPCEYAGLAGAPDDARVEIGALRGMLYIEMGAPTAGYRAHYYLRRAGGDIVLINDGFHIYVRALRGRGFGLQVFHRQVRNAARLGIRRIETVAGRHGGERSAGHVGHPAGRAGRPTGGGGRSAGRGGRSADGGGRPAGREERPVSGGKPACF